MARRSSLIACAVGAAIADLAWLAVTASRDDFTDPAGPDRYELHTGQPPYDSTLGRLVECGATRIMFEDLGIHGARRWVLEASRHNRKVVECFDRRTISRALD